MYFVLILCLSLRLYSTSITNFTPLQTIIIILQHHFLSPHSLDFNNPHSTTIDTIIHLDALNFCKNTHTKYIIYTRMRTTLPILDSSPPPIHTGHNAVYPRRLLTYYPTRGLHTLHQSKPRQYVRYWPDGM